MAAPAHADPCSGGYGSCIIGNRNRFELDLMMQYDDLRAQMALGIANYPPGTAISQTEPSTPTADNDARCNNWIRQKLNGMTTTNSSDQQKIDKANEVIAMFKGQPSQGGLGNAMPARSGFPAQPSGWASFYGGLPKDSNNFRVMEILDRLGGSWGVRIYAPNNDPSAATATALNNIKSPSETTGGATNPASCPW